MTGMTTDNFLDDYNSDRATFIGASSTNIFTCGDIQKPSLSPGYIDITPDINAKAMSYISDPISMMGSNSIRANVEIPNNTILGKFLKNHNDFAYKPTAFIEAGISANSCSSYIHLNSLVRDINDPLTATASSYLRSAGAAKINSIIPDSNYGEYGYGGKSARMAEQFMGSLYPVNDISKVGNNYFHLADSFRITNEPIAVTASNYLRTAALKQANGLFELPYSANYGYMGYTAGMAELYTIRNIGEPIAVTASNYLKTAGVTQTKDIFGMQDIFNCATMGYSTRIAETRIGESIFINNHATRFTHLTKPTTSFDVFSRHNEIGYYGYGFNSSVESMNSNCYVPSTQDYGSLGNRYYSKNYNQSFGKLDLLIEKLESLDTSKKSVVTLNDILKQFGKFKDSEMTFDMSVINDNRRPVININIIFNGKIVANNLQIGDTNIYLQ